MVGCIEALKEQQDNDKGDIYCNVVFERRLIAGKKFFFCKWLKKIVL